MAEKKKTKKPSAPGYANCTAPAAGRSWLDGGTPKNFSSPWQRGQKESFARQDFKAEVKSEQGSFSLV